jgi:hypothetical protein
VSGSSTIVSESQANKLLEVPGCFYTPDSTLNNVGGNQTFIDSLKYKVVNMSSLSIVLGTIGCCIVVVLATMGFCVVVGVATIGCCILVVLATICYCAVLGFE